MSSEGTCEVCGWSGFDVEVFEDRDSSDPEPVKVCQACVAAIGATDKAAHLAKVSDLRPVDLIPIIRSCVAQSVGAILADVLTRLSQADPDEPLVAVIDMIKNRGSADPN